MALHELHNGHLRVSVDDLGAQLSSVTDAAGRELLWQGGTAWQRRAPILFPIVGRLPGDQLHHDGRSYRLTQHGFARDEPFAVERTDDSSATFVLDDNESTRKTFPFAFRLEVTFALVGATLEVRHVVSNPGASTLHASLGGHPGFAWPLPGAGGRAEHTLTFEEDEPDDIRRINGDGELIAETFPTPVEGRSLLLDESLFAADAMIFDSLTSRSVAYSAAGAPTITVAFPDFPLLGVWSRSPGEFVCIEPWFGMTSPVGYDGDFADKPGQFALEPGESRPFLYSIAVTDERIGEKRDASVR
jgi:galactose mutarotase-like enzyme